MRLKFVTLALLPLLLAACSASTPTAPPTAPQAITIEAAAMHYQPASIEVTAGRPVLLTFKNGDSLDHDFSVMEIPMTNGTPMAASSPVAGHDMGGMAGMGTAPMLHVAVSMGSTGTLQFTPSTPGTYQFICTVAGHKEAGMVGTLIVKAP